jgi:cyclopropane fatty-acyl-phospholipid synthase-like methyltransferase
MYREQAVSESAMENGPVDQATLDLRQSEANAESVADWWNRAHKEASQLWLTGSLPEQVWSRLGVESLLRPGATVLNIGVGLGLDTRALVERGCETHVYDISSSALQRVSDVATGWLAGTALPEATFDVALSHLVAQHMSDADLAQQFRYVIAALKPMGVFAIQFAYRADAPEATDGDGPLPQKAGGVLRSPERMRGMIEEAGGLTLRDWQCENFGAAAFHTLHAARR